MTWFGITLPAMPWIVWGTLLRRHATVFTAALAVVAALLFCLTLADFARRGARAGLPFAAQLEMALLQTPDLLLQALPLVMLIAAMISHVRMANRNVFLVLRASGHTPAHLLLPAAAGATALGLLFVGLVSPVSAQLVQRLDLLEARHFSGASSRLTVSSGGIWLRQSDAEGQSVIRARAADGSAARLEGVEVYRFDSKLNLFEQISADAATLGNLQWTLRGVRLRNLVEGPDSALPQEVVKETHALPTSLTPDDIIESFAPPSALSVWQLPEFISSLEASGFDSSRHQTQLWFLLTLPLVMAVMATLAAVAGMRHPSLARRGLRCVLALIAGVAFFVALSAVQVLTTSSQLPVAISLCSTVIASGLAAFGAYLHWEPG